MYSGYNESLLILNGVVNDPACKGTVDTSVTPPVLRFELNLTNSCESTFRTDSAPGTGVFSDFSNIQTVNISGVVRSNDPTIGTVSYNVDLRYFYSCAYPLEYLINNNQINTSGSSIAVRDTNGSFLSTLSLELFSDPNYTTPMIIPRLGIELKTKIFAQVRAINLTTQYHVLLDRCYASMSPLPANSTFYNLFVSCSQDLMTTIYENGDSQHARFSFTAFRFKEQQNEILSTYYLHCVTRLCEKSTCSAFKQCRRRRSVDPATNAGTTDVQTITSPPITTKLEGFGESQLTHQKNVNSFGLWGVVGFLSFLCLVAVVTAGVFCRMLNRKKTGKTAPDASW
ncbi:zona pellucida-like domain-containing protein 1 [Esox lucius]|nr:zona pellucida-like domain-containing protein 1 [Esox lucius]